MTLVLETLSESHPDLGRMVPLWGEPQIVGSGPAERPPNVLLISVDTLRADRMSAYGHSRPTTPGLDAWAESSGIRFETVVAPSPWTLPSHASLFSGLDAVSHGVNFSAPADPSLETLAERLRAAGYTTAGFTAGAYLDPKFGLAQGFDLFRARQEGPGGTDTANELEEGLDQVRAWLQEEPSAPFFLFFHTYEVHTPYRAREPYFGRFRGDRPGPPGGQISTRNVAGDQDVGFRNRKEFIYPTESFRRGPSLSPRDYDLVRAAYDSGIAYMDHHVARFLGEFEDMGLASNTVVVLTSDHGELLGEHDLAAHGYLYDENLLVPLILSLPDGRGAGSVVSDQVRLIDLFPTLLELAGLRPRGPIDGESLLPLLDRPRAGRAEPRHRQAWSYAASSNYGLSLRYADRWKFIFPNAVWPAVRDEQELYDLRRDPRELENLAPSSQRTAALGSEAREYLSSRASGLRLRFTNAGPATMSGTLSGPMILVAGVTSPDLACACVRWAGARSLNVEIPPGEEFTLHLEQAGTGDLVIEGDLTGAGAAAAFRHAVDVGELETRSDFWFDGSTWTSEVAAEARSPVTGIQVWWEGEKRSLGEEPVEDAALQEQLRALGYLN